MTTQISTIAPGSIGLDYSGARPDPAGLAAAGVKWVSRYSSRPPNGKNLESTVPEVGPLHAAGLGICLNHEQTQGGMLASGAEVLAMAKVAVANALALPDGGYPHGLPIWFSHDVAPVSPDRPKLMANYRIVQQVLVDSGFDDGAYGGLVLMEWLEQEGLCRRARWQSYGWSTVVGPKVGTAAFRTAGAIARGQVQYPGWQVIASPNETGVAIVLHPTAHAFQQFGRVRVSTSAVPDSIDENVALRPFPVWLPNSGSSSPGGPTLSYLALINGGDHYLVEAGGAKPLGLWALQNDPTVIDLSARHQTQSGAVFGPFGQWCLVPDDQETGLILRAAARSPFSEQPAPAPVSVQVDTTALSAVVAKAAGDAANAACAPLGAAVSGVGSKVDLARADLAKVSKHFT